MLTKDQRHEWFKIKDFIWALNEEKTAGNQLKFIKRLKGD